MSAVLKTVWFIESRFRDGELSLERMAEHAGVTREQLVQIAKNSFEGSFLPDEDKARHIAEVDAYAARAA